MTEFVGGLVTLGVGVIVVAAIFQLSKATNPTASDVTAILRRSEKAMFT